MPDTGVSRRSLHSQSRSPEPANHLLSRWHCSLDSYFAYIHHRWLLDTQNGSLGPCYLSLNDSHEGPPDTAGKLVVW